MTSSFDRYIDDINKSKKLETDFIKIVSTNDKLQKLLDVDIFYPLKYDTKTKSFNYNISGYPDLVLTAKLFCDRLIDCFPNLQKDIYSFKNRNMLGFEFVTSQEFKETIERREWKLFCARLEEYTDFERSLNIFKNLELQKKEKKKENL
jgi:hypothetical protein